MIALFSRSLKFALSLSALLTLLACSGTPGEHRTKDEIEREKNGSIFDNFGGAGKIRIGGKAVQAGDRPGGIGGGILRGGRFSLGGDPAGGPVVNESIWRASYELASVLPVAAANRERGVIETDWYAPPGVTNEQMRLVIFVGSGAVSPNAVKVNAFKRGFDAQGRIVQSAASPSVIQELENAILRKARAQ